MNIQPIEKRRLSDDGSSLDVHSVFYTIQGEGPFAGRPAVFIRLAGCNLQCPACDTEYTKDRWHASPNGLLELVNEMAPEWADALVVITGGEPFRQNIEPLVAKLISETYTVQIETNGTLAPPIGFDKWCSTNTQQKERCFIVCSPKTGKVNPRLEPIICAYKYVMRAGDAGSDDGLPLTALDHTASPFLQRPHAGFQGAVYLQPCDDKDLVQNAKNLQACVKSVMQYGYTLQLQIHKIINME